MQCVLRKYYVKICDGRQKVQGGICCGFRGVSQVTISIKVFKIFLVMIFSCEEILRKGRYLVREVQEDICYVREVEGL